MLSKHNNKELEKQYIEQINKLYITTRKRYLIMNKIEVSNNNKVSTTGKYYSIHQEQKRYVPLNDSHLVNHLRGKSTVGVFSGNQYSKFLCFDLDIKDKDKLKWVYYLLVDSLNDLGISNQHIHTATSGNKGIHINIFIDNGASLSSLINLFNATMQTIKSKLPNEIQFTLHSDNEHSGNFEFGQIEMRPTATQGVKIELGRNFFNPNFNTNKCSFLDNETLELLDDDYLLSIIPMDKEEFTDIIDEIKDTPIHIHEHINEKVIKSEVEEIKMSITEPKYMKINKDENETIEYVTDLITNGLRMEGTRHNSCLKIAKYFRYIGCDLEECVQHLQEWMMLQDNKYYSSDLEYALSECERISTIVYEKGYTLYGNVENITIHKSEIEKILSVNSKYDKLILYSMLIHSKRYAQNNGVFYMTYEQMNEMCGISRPTAIKSIEKLDELGLVEVVSRNVRSENKGYKKKPNKYKLLLNVELDEIVLEINNTSETLNSNELYLKSLTNTYTNKELKKLLPDKQYREVYKYRNSIAS